MAREALEIENIDEVLPPEAKGEDPGLSDRVKAAFKDLFRNFEKEGEEIRGQRLKGIKYHLRFWHNDHHIYWSEELGDWRPFSESKYLDSELEADIAANGRFVGDYRAHLSSIIAALSASIPITRFSPEDPDNPDDISTARAYTTIGKGIQNSNDPVFLLLRTLFILANQGIVFGYNCYHKDKKYGTKRVPEYEEKEETFTDITCPNCGSAMDESMEVDYDPGDEVTPEQTIMQCPGCGAEVEPEINERKEMVPYVKAWREEGYGKELLYLYGETNVKIPNNLTSLESSPYIILYTEQYIAQMVEFYPHLRDKLYPTKDDEERDRWARARERYVGTENICTVAQGWFRPWAYNEISDKDLRKEAQEKFPNGCCIVMIGDQVAEMYDENMDDHWTCSVDALSEDLHSDAIGKPLIPLNEMKNDSLNLTVECLEHSIPLVFADAETVNLPAFRDARISPGSMYPVDGPSAQNLESKFFTVKTATVPNEIWGWFDKLDMMQQFVSGDHPAIFGGANPNRTAKEYEMARNQGLQVLSLPWKTLTAFLPRLIRNAVEEYVSQMSEDARFTEKNGANQINVWVRMADLKGKVGNVDVEASDQFPHTWAQRRAALFELISSGNEAIMTAIFHPENIQLVMGLIGLPDMYVPGQDDREYQLREIGELLKGVPVDDGMGGQLPSIMPDPELDQAEIHIETTRAFLKSEFGQIVKEVYPDGYLNVLLHLRAHLQAQQMAAMQAQPQTVPGQNGSPPAPEGPAVNPEEVAPPAETPEGMVQ